MLVQAGADLNARTRYEETPEDICEDLELRERITALRTEQESRRQDRRRVRPSHSNNTRTQSVRRTSIRDKSLTSKKDAVEEARLRLTLSPQVFILWYKARKRNHTPQDEPQGKLVGRFYFQSYTYLW